MQMPEKLRNHCRTRKNTKYIRTIERKVSVIIW